VKIDITFQIQVYTIKLNVDIKVVHRWHQGDEEISLAEAAAAAAALI